MSSLQSLLYILSAIAFKFLIPKEFDREREAQRKSKIYISQYSNMTIVEMIVTMDCAGCENKIRSALKKMKGVDAVDVDFNMQKVTVMGWADQEKVLRAVRKTGKRAELWPYPYNPQYHSIGLDYYQQHQPLDHHHSHHRHKHHHDRGITANQLPITTYKSVPKSSSYSYNYYKHGSTNQEHGYYQPPPYSTMFTEQATAVFSDENPHACSIM